MAKGIALLVGLKEVDPDQYGGWDGKEGCFGCEKDVEIMRGILHPMGYEVKALLTREATAKNILDGIRESIARLEKGDIFVFYFSGHGGQTLELKDGYEDEKDGLDETLIAYDRRIIDDELNEIWCQAVEGARLVMVSDSCNSGTNYMTGIGLEFAGPEIMTIKRNESARMRAQLIHFGGCQDGSASAGYLSGGEFTASLCAAWDEGRFGGNYKEFYYEIMSLIESEQKPQYREYGPVSDEFRGSRPFQISEKARLSLNLEIVADNPATIRELVEEDLVRIVQKSMEKSLNTEIHPVNEMSDSPGKWSASGTLMRAF